MNKPASRPPHVAGSASSGAQPKRRQLVVGAGVAAGAALAAAALRQHAVEAPAALARAEPEPAASPGYRLTDHVRRYYDTTRT